MLFGIPTSTAYFVDDGAPATCAYHANECSRVPETDGVVLHPAGVVENQRDGIGDDVRDQAPRKRGSHYAAPKSPASTHTLGARLINVATASCVASAAASLELTRNSTPDTGMKDVCPAPSW